ncbi:hypothetical protein, partial [Salmonella sp. s51933]|uniref:hypothetical protein n=1 Tax=Salmonella sp. s51933 TaxID=3160127 RepID=UPI003754D0C2
KIIPLLNSKSITRNYCKIVFAITALVVHFALVFFAFSFVAVVQEDEGKQEEAGHHGEGTCVIRESRNYEPLILGVFKRTD